MMKKYTGLALTLFFVMGEAQVLDGNEIKNQLKELYRKLYDVAENVGFNGQRLSNIEHELEYKCPGVFDGVKAQFVKVRGNMDNLYKQIDLEIGNVQHGLENSEDQRGFPEYKKKIEKLLVDCGETFLHIDGLAKILNTCSASRSYDETVPQSGGTTNIPLATVTLTMAAAFIAIKLAFH